jgi:hypothetical protein
VLASPSRMCAIPAHCFFRAFSMTSQPSMRFFSLLRKEYSMSESCLKFCASSNLKITSWAMCSFSLASESRELAQYLSALEVTCNLCPSLWNGSVWVVGALQARSIVSWKFGSCVHKFSNLNGVERYGLLGQSKLEVPYHGNMGAMSRSSRI